MTAVEQATAAGYSVTTKTTSDWSFEGFPQGVLEAVEERLQSCIGMQVVLKPLTDDHRKVAGVGFFDPRKDGEANKCQDECILEALRCAGEQPPNPTVTLIHLS